VKKRTVALAFLALVLALVGGTIAALRTRWAADRICALAGERIARTTGLELAVAACRIRPFALELEAEGVRLGSAQAPIFTADALVARLAPIQALGRQLHLSELRLVRPRLAVPAPRPTDGTGGVTACPPAILARFEVRHLDVEDGAVDVPLPGGRRVAIDRLDVRSRPGQTQVTFRPRTIASADKPKVITFALVRLRISKTLTSSALSTAAPSQGSASTSLPFSAAVASKLRKLL